MEEAQGELYVLSGSIHAPELEVSYPWHVLANLSWLLTLPQVDESRREIRRIFNEIAPPPPPAPAGSITVPQDDTNGAVPNESDEEENNEGNRQ